MSARAAAPALPKQPIDSGWRADLLANCGRRGWRGLIAGWLTSPGFRMISRYRLARRLYLRGGLARPLSVLVEQVNADRGCYISARAEIGAGLRLPHPVGIVIGEGSIVGEWVSIYQQVTLGRRHAEGADYPIVEDGATIYVGATLIGRIRIGRDARIGAHRLVRADVPAGGNLPAQ